MLEKFIKIFKKKETIELENSVEDKINEMFNSLNSNIIELLLGNDFLDFKDTVLNTIFNYREKLQETTGFILPPVHVLSNEDLQENEFVLKVQNQEVTQIFVIPNEKNVEEELEKALEYLYENHLDNIFTIEIAEKYINSVQVNQPWSIWNLTCMYSIAEIKNVLIGILKNKKSLNNINYIFEKFAKYTLDSGFCCHYSVDKITKEIIKHI